MLENRDAFWLFQDVCVFTISSIISMPIFLSRFLLWVFEGSVSSMFEMLWIA